MATTQNVLEKIALLNKCLRASSRCTIAVSGGIDSMLLSWIACRYLGKEALIVHASSPAVSKADGCRVRDYATQWQWNYQEITSEQIHQEIYQSNPLNRCYYCKSGLYRQLGKFNHGQIMTGTNLDDLGDFRPGLIAAQEQGVRHPYIECGINKNTIRDIAAHFGLTDLQSLPASPCLSSRIETGLRINTKQLSLIDRVEEYLRQHLPDQTVRLRIRKGGLVLELATATLDRLSTQEKMQYLNHVSELARESGIDSTVHFAPYQQGSAFVGNKSQQVAL